MKNYLIIIAIVGICLSGCKTRQVQSSKTEVSKSTEKNNEFAIKKNVDSSSTDNSSEIKKTTVEAKTTAKTNTTFIADSIVVTKDKKGVSKTKIYTRGPVNISSDQSSEESTSIVDSTQNRIDKRYRITLDSLAKIREKTQTDSLNKIKNTQAKGSGQTLAIALPVVGGLVFIVALLLLYRYFKK